MKPHRWDHVASNCQLDLWLVTVLWLERHGPPLLPAVPTSCLVIYISLDPLPSTHLQANCNRCWHAASCHLLATDTWYWFLLQWDTSLGTMVVQMLKCQWWINVGLKYSICHHHSMYTSHTSATIKFLTSKCFYALFNQTPLHLTQPGIPSQKTRCFSNTAVQM